MNICAHTHYPYDIAMRTLREPGLLTSTTLPRPFARQMLCRHGILIVVPIIRGRSFDHVALVIVSQRSQSAEKKARPFGLVFWRRCLQQRSWSRVRLSFQGAQKWRWKQKVVQGRRCEVWRDHQKRFLLELPSALASRGGVSRGVGWFCDCVMQIK